METVDLDEALGLDLVDEEWYNQYTSGWKAGEVEREAKYKQERKEYLLKELEKLEKEE